MLLSTLHWSVYAPRLFPIQRDRKLFMHEDKASPSPPLLREICYSAEKKTKKVEQFLTAPPRSWKKHTAYLLSTAHASLALQERHTRATQQNKALKIQSSQHQAPAACTPPGAPSPGAQRFLLALAAPPESHPNAEWMQEFFCSYMVFLFHSILCYKKLSRFIEDKFPFHPLRKGPSMEVFLKSNGAISNRSTLMYQHLLAQNPRIPPDHITLRAAAVPHPGLPSFQ